MDEIGILPRYRGTCVHDAWWSYNYYTQCKHSLCGAHLLRELTFFAELSTEQQRWAEPLRKLLLEIKGAVEEASSSGRNQLSVEEQAAFVTRYDQLVSQGLEANPAQVRGAGPEKEIESLAVELRVRTSQPPPRNLLLRMQRRREEVLHFMTDFSVPFDNNQAERDLRMIKLQQKVGGCFRSEEGARRFCRIRGYLSTMRKQGKNVLKALERACRGHPLSPTS